jgi:hypothetical protein
METVFPVCQELKFYILLRQISCFCGLQVNFKVTLYVNIHIRKFNSFFRQHPALLGKVKVHDVFREILH